MCKKLKAQKSTYFLYSKMSSSAVATAFATVLSLGLSRIINTGDRGLDNALLTLVLALNTVFMAFLADDDLYNKFIYYIIDRPKVSSIFTQRLYKFEKIKQEYQKNMNTSRDDISYSLISGCAMVLGSQQELEMNNQFKSIYRNYSSYANEDPIITHRPTSNNTSYLFPIAIYNGVFVYIYTLRGIGFNEYRVYSKNKLVLDMFLNEYGFVKKAEKQDTTTMKLCVNSEKPSGLISARKTFDTLFYDQKPQLMRLLEKFKTGCLYPDTISMDNKLGILLYGPPGTGKTGTISAIANYLQRDVMIINFAELTKCSELDALLKPSIAKKHIYVFDEFDCILDVMAQGNRQVAEAPAEKTDWATMLAVATEKEERQKILDMMREGAQKNKKPDRIDLGYLLQKLDGIEDNNDRIIIATTNHPENINPALLRPGRFDLKLCLGNCSSQMYEDILTNFFKGGDDMRLQVAKAGLVAKKWSPLQVINTAIVNETLEKTLEVLKS